MILYPAIDLRRGRVVRLTEGSFDAEKAYFSKVGVKEGRDAFLEALRGARQPQPELKTKSWPWRYAARRVAWHVLDHAWEMEDRSD